MLPPSHEVRGGQLHQLPTLLCFNCDDTSPQIEIVRYPTPHQGQMSPTGHQPIFNTHSHQGSPMCHNSLNFPGAKKYFLLTIAQTHELHCEDTTTQVATMRSLPHTTSGPKVAYWSSAHILLTLPPRAPHNSQQVSLHTKIFRH